MTMPKNETLERWKLYAQLLSSLFVIVAVPISIGLLKRAAAQIEENMRTNDRQQVVLEHHGSLLADHETRIRIVERRD